MDRHYKTGGGEGKGGRNGFLTLGACRALDSTPPDAPRSNKTVLIQNDSRGLQKNHTPAKYF